jgi:hypothetical protein
MPTRTPKLQTRSQYNPHWGVYANPGTLPNASGAPLLAADFTLEAGDVAYVTGSGLYVCVSPGTVGGADATWTAVGGASQDRYPVIDADTLLAWNLANFTPQAIGGVTPNLGSGGSAADGTISSPYVGIPSFDVLAPPGVKGVGSQFNGNTSTQTGVGTPIYTAVRQPIEAAAEFTIAAWFNLVALPRDGQSTRIVWKTSGISWPEDSEYTRVGIGMGAATPPTLNVWAGTNLGVPSQVIPMDGAGGLRWTIGPHFVVAVHKIVSGSYEQRVYWDGTFVGNVISAAASSFRLGATTTSRDGPWGMGQDPGFSSQIIEGHSFAMRVDKVARSAAWVEDAARRFFQWPV